MVNNGNKNKMDPTRINNYNKFLSTLDHKSKLNDNEKNAIKILSEKFKNSKVENDIKDDIDKFIDKINTTNILTSNFTGQTSNDMSCVNNIDPNYYTYSTYFNDISNINNIVDIFNVFEHSSFQMNIYPHQLIN